MKSKTPKKFNFTLTKVILCLISFYILCHTIYAMFNQNNNISSYILIGIVALFVFSLNIVLFVQLFKYSDEYREYLREISKKENNDFDEYYPDFEL